VALDEELVLAAKRAGAFAAPGEQVEAVLAAEPGAGTRLYVCAFAGVDGDARSWLVLDGASPVTSRALVREAVSLAALCEVVGEAAGDAPPRVASPAYLDEFGTPEVVAGAFAAVESLTQQVEAAYKKELR
jgi:hypothetical protein